MWRGEGREGHFSVQAYGFSVLRFQGFEFLGLRGRGALGFRILRSVAGSCSSVKLTGTAWCLVCGCFFRGSGRTGRRQEGMQGHCGLQRFRFVCVRVVCQGQRPLGYEMLDRCCYSYLKPAHFQTRTDKILESQPLGTPDIIPYSPKNP